MSNRLCVLAFVVLTTLVSACKEKQSNDPKKVEAKTELKKEEKKEDGKGKSDPAGKELSAAEKMILAKQARAKADIQSLSNAVKLHKLYEGFYPRELKALLSEGRRGKGPFIKELVKDPWGRDYHYEYLKSGRFRLYSFGKDGKAGGDGENADIDPFAPPKGNLDSSGKKAVYPK